MIVQTAEGIYYQWRSELYCWCFQPIPISPVTFSVPHNRGFYPHDLEGLLAIRRSGTRGQDQHVWALIKDILLAAPINAVRGLFPRDYVDYNRAWPDGVNYDDPKDNGRASTALDDPQLYPIYETYHSLIASCIRDAIESWGARRCLLIDCHGFSKQPAGKRFDVILGTGHRATVSSDIDQRLASHLSERGYSVFLPVEDASQRDFYSADYTTWHYSQRFGIDAIQVEIANWFRTAEGVEQGKKLATDFANFFQSLL